MPEGPEVALFARELQAWVGGASLTSIEVREACPYPPKVTDINLPWTGCQVRPWGKKVIFDFETSWIVFTLGMEGHFDFRDGKHCHVVLRFDTGHDVFFHDTRHFGRVVTCPTKAEYTRAIRAVGKDLLQGEVTREAWLEVITRPRLAKKTVASFVMEQKYFAGVGNYCRSDSLYLAGIDPLRTLGSLSQTEASRLLVAVRRVLRESLELGGLTISTFVLMSGKEGGYKPYVYGRKKDDEGNTVVRITLDGRSIFWVPEVQK